MDIEILKSIQPYQKRWAEYNFGENRSPIHGLLGVGEEVGELKHAVLKKMQGIRGTAEEHQTEIEDACADIVIFMLDYCNLRGFNLYEALQGRREEDVLRTDNAEPYLLSLGSKLGLLDHCENTNQATEKHVAAVIIALERFCLSQGLDLWQLVYDTWQIVSQRDWKKYPKTGFPDKQPGPKEVTAEQILEDGKAVLAARGLQYNGSGGRERHMAQITDAFNAMTGKKLTPVEGWLFMVCLKGVRAGAGGGLDTFMDGGNYFALAGEEKSRG